MPKVYDPLTVVMVVQERPVLDTPLPYKGERIPTQNVGLCKTLKGIYKVCAAWMSILLTPEHLSDYRNMCIGWRMRSL